MNNEHHQQDSHRQKKQDQSCDEQGGGKARGLQLISPNNQPMDKAKKGCQQRREIHAVTVDEGKCFVSSLGSEPVFTVRQTEISRRDEAHRTETKRQKKRHGHRDEQHESKIGGPRHETVRPSGGGEVGCHDGRKRPAGQQYEDSRDRQQHNKSRE